MVVFKDKKNFENIFASVFTSKSHSETLLKFQRFIKTVDPFSTLMHLFLDELGIKKNPSKVFSCICLFQ